MVRKSASRNLGGKSAGRCGDCQKSYQQKSVGGKSANRFGGCQKICPAETGGKSANRFGDCQKICQQKFRAKSAGRFADCQIIYQQKLGVNLPTDLVIARKSASRNWGDICWEIS